MRTSIFVDIVDRIKMLKINYNFYKIPKFYYNLGSPNFKFLESFYTSPY